MPRRTIPGGIFFIPEANYPQLTHRQDSTYPQQSVFLALALPLYIGLYLM